MADTVLLVDLENVGKVDLKAIPAEFRVLVFFGSSDKKVPMELFDAALELKDRFAHIKIDGQGKNALDFHIAFYLGELLQKEPNTRCIVLSKDKGFDPLVKHLVGRYLNVSRVASLGEATKQLNVASKDSKPVPKEPKPKTKSTTPRPSLPADPYAQAVAWIESIEKKKRPQKRMRLIAHVFNHFGKKIPEADVQAFVDRLVSEKRLDETNGALTYNF